MTDVAGMFDVYHGWQARTRAQEPCQHLEHDLRPHAQDLQRPAATVKSRHRLGVF
jgi:hypothetical protein